ncbi:MAG TPA: hypothetical protein VHK86_03010 [Nitrososphaera sp.]|nr:hypothetical protein [Nitrososphaera sp.]
MIKEHSAEFNIALRKAIEETLTLLGEPGRRMLISVLESWGLHSCDGHLDISLEKLSRALSELFGDDMAESIMEDVLLRMDRICCQLQPLKENSRDNPGTVA